MMKLSAAFLVVFAIIGGIRSACVCREGGTAVCKCDPTYVKPQAKASVASSKSTICRTVGAQEFKPIGDICSCGAVKVEPHQRENGKRSGSECGCGGRRSEEDRAERGQSEVERTRERILEEERTRSSLYNEYEISGAQFDDNADLYKAEKSRKKSKEQSADTVSIILALEEQERANKKVPESKLLYGPSGKIIDGSTRKIVPDLNEGGLYKLAGTRLALKKFKRIDDSS